MKASTSYRNILRSSSIMGAASVMNIIIGLVRTKVAAIFLGPAGIGLIGLLQNIVGFASTLAGCGLGIAGTRQIAATADNALAVAIARRALFGASLVLSILGGTVFFALREQLAAGILADPRLASTVGWLAFGVALNVASASQGALLQGLRRIGDLARLQVSSAALSTLMSVAAVVAWGEKGIMVFILAAPLASFILGHCYVSRLEQPKGQPPNLAQLAKQWLSLARLGAAFMAAGLTSSLGFLITRSLVQHQLGAPELGHYQAAWAISMTYLGLVLSSMATDYFPRLSAAISNHEEAARLINEQTEVVLLIGGPLIVGMMALAPLVINVLYTAEFAVAADILRWQVLGDIFKIVSWPLGFVLLASGASLTYMLAESSAILVFVSVVWRLLPTSHIVATGIAFLAMYLAYLPLVFLLARKRIGFMWSMDTMLQMGRVLLAAGSTMLFSRHSELLAAVVGCILALALGLQSLRRINNLTSQRDLIGRLAIFNRLHKLLGKM